MVNTPPPSQKVQPVKPFPTTTLKAIPPPPTKKPTAAVIPSKPNPAPTSLPKLPPLRPAPNPEPQNVAKPLTPRTVDPLKAENISKTTVSTDSNKSTNTSNVLSSILPNTTSVMKEKVSHAVKEKTTVKDNKTTSKDKTGFMLPTPKPPTTKPGIVVYILTSVLMASRKTVFNNRFTKKNSNLWPCSSVVSLPPYYFRVVF